MSCIKILYYFNNYSTYMFQWQVTNIVNEMKMNNCDIQIFSPIEYESMDIANEALLKTIVSEKYDLFMTCLNEKYLYLDTLKNIKKIGLPTLLFCPDNLLAPFNHEHIAKLFDLVWLTSKETEYLFHKWGCKTIFLPYAANPFFLQPDYSRSEILCAGFIGNPHGSRSARINALTKAGVAVTVHMDTKKTIQKDKIESSKTDYFATLKTYSRYSVGRKLAIASIIEKVFGKSTLNLASSYLTVKDSVPMDQLSVTNCQYAFMLSFCDAKSTGILKSPVPIVNLRNFEIPMAGGLQFTTYTDEMASYFEDGKEIVLCKNSDEYIDKAKYYLRKELAEKRQKMRLAARKRAEKEHSWSCRFNKIFNEIGLTKK